MTTAIVIGALVALGIAIVLLALAVIAVWGRSTDGR